MDQAMEGGWVIVTSTDEDVRDQGLVSSIIVYYPCLLGEMKIMAHHHFHPILSH